MISRTALALAAALLAAPAAVAQPVGGGQSGALAAPVAYASHRYRAVHRPVLFRDRAYVGRRHYRHHHRWHAHRRLVTTARYYPAPVRVSYRVRYVYPMTGSYVGGAPMGALYNQPLCPCY